MSASEICRSTQGLFIAFGSVVDLADGRSAPLLSRDATRAAQRAIRHDSWTSLRSWWGPTCSW